MQVINAIGERAGRAIAGGMSNGCDLISNGGCGGAATSPPPNSDTACPIQHLTRFQGKIELLSMALSGRSRLITRPAQPRDS